MWTDELQERAVAKRQPRLQEAVDAAAQDPPEPPPSLAASAALALITPEDIARENNRRWEEDLKRKAEENKRVLAEFQQEQLATKLDAHRRFGRVAVHGLSDMEERIVHGEPMVDETGNVIGYRPIRTRDLDSIISTAIDKQLAIEKRILGEDNEGSSTVIPPSVTSLLERLELLAQQNPIKGKVPGEYREPKVIDVEAGD